MAVPLPVATRRPQLPRSLHPQGLVVEDKLEKGASPSSGSSDEGAQAAPAVAARPPLGRTLTRSTSLKKAQAVAKASLPKARQGTVFSATAHIVTAGAVAGRPGQQRVVGRPIPAARWHLKRCIALSLRPGPLFAPPTLQ